MGSSETVVGGRAAVPSPARQGLISDRKHTGSRCGVQYRLLPGPPRCVLSSKGSAPRLRANAHPSRREVPTSAQSPTRPRVTWLYLSATQHSAAARASGGPLTQQGDGAWEFDSRPAPCYSSHLFFEQLPHLFLAFS